MRSLCVPILGVPVLAGVMLAVGLFESSAFAQQFEQGKSLYVSLCTACHGAAGEGVAEKRDQPLRGDLSVLELAETIRETMPEDAPGSLSQDDASAIAVWEELVYPGSPNAEDIRATARDVYKAKASTWSPEDLARLQAICEAPESSDAKP